MLLATYPNAHLLAVQPRIGPAVSTNLGIADATGEVVVLARTTANPPRDAFHGLVSALADHDVAIAQPLVVDRPGLVVSAGAVFGPGRTHPEPFLAGHPVRDAQALTSREVPAPLSPVVAVRGSELVRLRGVRRLDRRRPARRSSWGTDGRAPRRRPVVVPQSPLVLKAGQLPRLDYHLGRGAGTAGSLADRPRRVGGGMGEGGVRRRRPPLGGPLRPPGTLREPLDAPALTPRTVVRASRTVVREGAPVLRWALDIAAPSGRRGQRWGDTYFARSMADALERLGQRVTIDTRDLRHRDTRDLDDVVLVLRGLDHVAPRPGRVNLQWVISHPDLVTGEELAGFDRVYAASATWAARTTAATGVAVTPLLQCTDPHLFNPDRGEPGHGRPGAVRRQLP